MDHAAPNRNSGYTSFADAGDRCGSASTNCIETVQYEFRLYKSYSTELLDKIVARKAAR